MKTGEEMEIMYLVVLMVKNLILVFVSTQNFLELYHAATTYDNAPDNRIVQIGWLNTKKLQSPQLKLINNYLSH